MINKLANFFNLFILINKKENAMIHVPGLPPTTHSSFPQDDQNNQALIKKFQGDIQNFENAWKNYINDPSNANEGDLNQAMTKLYHFLKDHASEIENICKNNNWHDHGPTGYMTMLTGAENGIQLMAMPPKETNLQILNEALNSLNSMMTLKNS